MRTISERLIPELGLVGTNGIDFVVNRDGVKVLEINPRFQGSVDAVELATGENVFQAHVDAINGKLRPFRIRQYGYRAIIFAARHLQVNTDLSDSMRADIPPLGTTCKKGDAVCTQLGKGRTRGEASNMARDGVLQVKKLLCGPGKRPEAHSGNR
jgi:predicted ATP-grasp superfamily ATP-dependent carboligase